MRCKRPGAVVATCVVILCAAGHPAIASAQSGERKVWVTRADGSEAQGRVVSFSATEILLRQDQGRLTTIPFKEIRLVEAPDGIGDGARNGALILGGMITVFGVIGAVSCDNCNGAGPFFVAGVIYGAALGAGFGACFDAAVTHREVIFSSTGASSHVSVRPMLSRRAAGVRVAVGWSKKR